MKTRQKGNGREEKINVRIMKTTKEDTRSNNQILKNASLSFKEGNEKRPVVIHIQNKQK